MTIAISGNTYSVKDQLKALGGRWDAARKAWMVPDEKAAEAQALVGGATLKPAPYRQVARPRINQPCRKCGSYCYGDCGAN